MKRPLLKLVRRGELVPSGKEIVASVKTEKKPEKKTYRILIPESREVLGCLYVEDDGHLSYEALVDDASADREVHCMLDEYNRYLVPENDPDGFWTPETRALHLTRGMGNLAYSNPRWEEIGWDEETAVGDSN